MTWHPYDLDQEAQKLVLKYRDKEVLNESHKMRVTIAFGLERFWGEHLRLLSRDSATDKLKGKYWRETWITFARIMKDAGIKNIPDCEVDLKKTDEIEKVAKQFWNTEQFSREDQTIALAVLTQFCDCLVWWTQRYKKKSDKKSKKNQEDNSNES
jgi:hypothetical protein